MTKESMGAGWGELSATTPTPAAELSDGPAFRAARIAYHEVCPEGVNTRALEAAIDAYVATRELPAASLGADALDAAKWRYTQQPGYYSTGPYNRDGEPCGVTVGVQKDKNDSLNSSCQGRGNTLDEAITKALALAPAPSSAGEGDWPEDFAHENGNYSCRCVTCGKEFIGHKRRVVCRKCHTPKPEADECAAISTGHYFSNCGPRGEVQCRYCGEPPKPEAGAVGDGDSALERARIEMDDEIRGGNFKGYELECLISWRAALARSEGVA